MKKLRTPPPMPTEREDQRKSLAVNNTPTGLDYWMIQAEHNRKDYRKFIFHRGTKMQLKKKFKYN